MSGAIVGGAIAAAGALGGAAISSNAAGNAAETQASAADRAAQLQYKASQDALDFQKQQYQTTQQNMAPWLEAGKSSLSNLQQLMGTASNPGSLMTPYSGTFTAPDAITEQNDPGFMARLKLGTDALQHSAAARGSVLTGGTAKALDQFAQDYASNEYSKVYDRALQGFQTNYNVYNQNQSNQFNKLAALSGIGQQTAGQLSTAGQNASNNVTNNLLGTAANMGQQYNNAAAATASGYVGSGNAWGGALGGIGGNLSNLYMMQQMGLFGGGSSNGGGTLFPFGNELGG